MRPRRSGWLAAGLLLAASIFAHRRTAEPLERTVSNIELFPAILAEWHCSRVESGKSNYFDPGVDRAFEGLCQSETKSPIEVYVGWATQSAAKRLRSPITNYYNEGSGGGDLRRSVRGLANGDPLPMTQMLLIENSKKKFAVTYWYQLDEKVLASDLSFRFYSLIALLKSRTSQAIIFRLQTELGNEASERVFGREENLAALLHVHASRILSRAQ